jgi:shikimate kinase/3-dehydroquinate synthase
MSKPIAIWGPPGSGKSTIAARCAELLGWRLLELDREIEARSQQSIPELFAKGEEHFRQVEREIARDVLQPNTIISLGGGTLVDDGLRELYQKETHLFRLDASHEALVRRIASQKNQRPLFASGPLSESLALLLERRRGAYQSVTAVIDTERLSIARAADAILRQAMPSDSIKLSLSGKEHEYHIGAGTLSSLGESLVQLGARGKVFLLVDRRAAAHHGARVRTSITAAGLQWSWVSLPPGELQKNSNILWRTLRFLTKEGADRGSFIVALGGGATCDLAALTASMYMRGVPLVLAPTTSLSMLDASIGGKTAINEWSAKNLIGTFYPPKKIIADVTTLTTLPLRERRAALAEAVKIALIADEGLFGWIETNADALISNQVHLDLWQELLSRSAKRKIEIVQQDFEERGLRKHLNLGHTIGHALEANCRDLLHGEAVSIGLYAAMLLSHQRGLCELSLVERVKSLLARLHLPIKAPRYSEGGFFSSLSLDKKREDQMLFFLLCKGFGEIQISRDVTLKEVQGILRALSHGGDAP